MASIRLENISRSYGTVKALKNIHLHIEEGEFFSLLGPSGSGKTTLLRLIAGFEPPTHGKILIGGKDVTSLPPERRKVGMVFQNYALFPHLDVFGNVAYGLRVLGMTRREISNRVAEMLTLVDLSGYEKRDVHTLSGGQQQRVALARALAPHPSVLLMDEPLSNLDTRLRIQTRRQISELQKRLGMTTIYVTHDQAEALSLSDRLAVMLRGEIVQVGTPQDIYHSPASVEVGEFLGEMNLFPCSLLAASPDDEVRIEFLGKEVSVKSTRLPEDVSLGDTVLAGVRPEAFGWDRLFSLSLEGEVEMVFFEGGTWRFEVRCAGNKLLIMWPTSWQNPCIKTGERLSVTLEPDSLFFFPSSKPPRS